MLYIMLAYLMLFAALSNAVCLYNVFLCFILPLIIASAFYFHALSLLLTHGLFISCVIFLHAQCF